MSQIGSRASGGISKVVVSAGGSGYTTPPTVNCAPATGFCLLAGSAVDSVVLTNAGSGATQSFAVTFSGGGGSGAAGTAYVAAREPMSFFRGRNNIIYGVDGGGRGVRWHQSSNNAQPIGLAQPANMPAVTLSGTSNAGYVRAVHLVSGGQGYRAEPTVTFTGGSPAKTASARATIANGRVVSIKVTEPGSGYQSPPSVSFSDGLGSAATFTVGVLGQVDFITITNPGSGYTESATQSPTAVFYNTSGMTQAYARFTVTRDGKLGTVVLVSSGTGGTGTAVAATVAGGGGSGGEVEVGMRFSVATLTVGHTGSGYMSPPVVSFRPDKSDQFGGGAAATLFVNATGNITGATVYKGGAYAVPPSAEIADTSARAQAEIARPLRGTYKCAIRYIDSTPAVDGGPYASSISDLAEIEIPDGANSINWTFSHSQLDARVSAMELWRTTADQSVLLFRVATIQRTAGTFTGTYSDTLKDDDLSDPERDGYALMPVTLPSGQINARRFEIPPGEMRVGCMFQDRAWYAVDATGLKPNSLYYSEVDEPESVPSVNELVIQENTGEPDKLVALIPLGGYLLLAQQSHLYKLSYVAQPVIDAAIVLVGNRGILNSRCWDVMGGVAFLVDSSGMYAFDGNNEEALSVAVDDYWRDAIIDFSKSSQCHVRADSTTRTVRFYYCQSSDSAPTRALCYCTATQAWWEETYPVAVTAGCPAIASGRRTVVHGMADGGLRKFSGLADPEGAVSYRLRTGAFPLATERGSRAVGFLYRPTTSDCTLNLSLHYNNSSTPRVNAVASDRGTGFKTDTGSTAAQLNLKVTRSPLGDSNGAARAQFAGRVDENSSGGDKHVAVAISGAQSADPVVFHSIAIEGTG